MMTRMRNLALRKNQKGLAIVEYVIVLAVVAALAVTVFGTGANGGGIGTEITNRLNRAIENIRSLPN